MYLVKKSNKVSILRKNPGKYISTIRQMTLFKNNVLLRMAKNIFFICIYVASSIYKKTLKKNYGTSIYLLFRVISWKCLIKPLISKTLIII